MNSSNIAIIAYTTFSTDTRVQKEAYAATDAGYKLDIFTLEDKNVTNFTKFNFIPSTIKQYKGQSRFNFVFSYIKFFSFTLFNLTIKSFSQKYKFVHVHNMPNFLVFCAIIPKLFGAKIILDIHDLMPEIFSVKFGLSINHWLIKLLYLEERFSAKFADNIIATNNFHIERFKKNKITDINISEIINVADNIVFYPPAEKDYNSDKLFLAYPSTLAKRLGIDDLIEAVDILHRKKIKFHLNIYGDGEYRSSIEKSIQEKELDQVVTLSNSFISLEQLSIELDKAHVGIIPLPSNVSNDIAMPVKIYEFFAKKVCVVATDLPLLKKCFHDSVLFYKQSNSEDLADKIEFLYNNRESLKTYSESGYEQFTYRTWEFYKERYKSILA